MQLTYLLFPHFGGFHSGLGDADDGDHRQYQERHRNGPGEEDRITPAGNHHGLVKSPFPDGAEDEPDDKSARAELVLVHQKTDDAEQDQGEDVEEALVDGVSAHKTEDGHAGEDQVLWQLGEFDPEFEAHLGDEVEQQVAHQQATENAVDQMGVLVKNRRSRRDALDQEGPG